MLILKPYIFKKFREIIFGFSTKTNDYWNNPFNCNMSYSVGDRSEIVSENREKFFHSLGLNTSSVAFQNQVHEDKVSIVENFGSCGKSDALITKKKNLGIAISTADCPAIFIYDSKQHIICGVHSGWRGTAKKIVEKSVKKLMEEFNSIPNFLYCYIAPSISQVNYPVSKKVAEQFYKDDYYIKLGKYFLDLAGANYRMLIKCGVKKSNVQVSKLCTYEFSSVFHSYRKQGEKSGRALALIAMKDSE